MCHVGNSYSHERPAKLSSLAILQIHVTFLAQQPLRSKHRAQPCRTIANPPPVSCRKKIGKSNSNAAEVAGTPGSAAQSVFVPLRELSKRSSHFGTWTVIVRQAQVDEYEYQWEGQKRSGKTFSCIFVSCEDPREYCVGQMKWTKREENKFRAIEQKLTDVFVLTTMKISLINDAKKQLIHSPIQIVVDVGGTQFRPVLSSKDSVDTYPEPPATIADCSLLTA